MRRIFYTLVVMMMATFHLSSCAQNKSQEQNTGNMKSTKTLVVYYSRTGNNYGVGNIKEGNTQVMAQMIADEWGADLFQVEPVKEYPADYTACTEVAKTEHNSNARPEIKADKDIAAYDTIFIGYPIWWGDAPMPLYTFIEKHQWNGKTVIPFCTHEGSGLCNEDDIQSACKGATLLKGLDMYGHVAQNNRNEARQQVHQWLNNIR